MALKRVHEFCEEDLLAQLLQRFKNLFNPCQADLADVVVIRIVELGVVWVVVPNPRNVAPWNPNGTALLGGRTGFLLVGIVRPWVRRTEHHPRG